MTNKNHNHGEIQAEDAADLSKSDVELENLFLQNIDFEQDITLRRYSAYGIYIVMLLWLIFLMVIISIEGCTSTPFELSDKVLIALIVSLTGNILLLPTIVLKYLFPRSK